MCQGGSGCVTVEVHDVHGSGAVPAPSAATGTILEPLQDLWPSQPAGVKVCRLGVPVPRCH